MGFYRKHARKHDIVALYGLQAIAFSCCLWLCTMHSALSIAIFFRQRVVVRPRRTMAAIMRRGNLVLWVIVSLAVMIFLQAPKTDLSSISLKRSTKIYHVALLPICNPGSVCNENTPNALQYSFFSHPNGVASFIRSSSNGQAFISGRATSWLKPKQKLRSAEEIINRSEELINLASDQLTLSDFDIFFLYTNVNGSGRHEISWPSGQIMSMSNGEYHAGLALMINSEIHFSSTAGNVSSAILPGTSWAIEFLRVAGLKENAHALSCKNERYIASCHLRHARDPFSVMGLGAFSLMLNWPMKRALSWAFQSDILKINKSGIYRLDVDDETAPKALEILIPERLKLNDTIFFDRVFIEQKTSTSFDRRVKKLHNKELLNRFSSLLDQHSDGAMLYLMQNEDGIEKTVSVDTKAKSVNVTKESKASYLMEMADAPLIVGQKFQVFDSTITVKLISATPRSLTIKVDGLGN